MGDVCGKPRTNIKTDVQTRSMIASLQYKIKIRRNLSRPTVDLTQRLRYGVRQDKPIATYGELLAQEYWRDGDKEPVNMRLRHLAKMPTILIERVHK